MWEEDIFWKEVVAQGKVGSKYFGSSRTGTGELLRGVKRGGRGGSCSIIKSLSSGN